MKKKLRHKPLRNKQSRKNVTSPNHIEKFLKSVIPAET